jgi:hypothetical protein
MEERIGDVGITVDDEAAGDSGAVPVLFPLSADIVDYSRPITYWNRVM